MHDPDALTPMMDAAARALDVALPDESRTAILRDMAVILDQARICEESLAGRTVELATVFRP